MTSPVSAEESRFTSTCGPDQVADANFGKLFSNVMGAGATGGSCKPNCDNSTNAPCLNVNDYICFNNAFNTALTLPAAQQVTSYANTDGSTSAPVLNVNDYITFNNQFAIGCNNPCLPH